MDNDDDVLAAQTRLLTTLAGVVLHLHQTGFAPERLRFQLQRQLAELEQASQTYNRLRQKAADVLTFTRP